MTLEGYTLTVAIAAPTIQRTKRTNSAMSSWKKVQINPPSRLLMMAWRLSEGTRRSIHVQMKGRAQCGVHVGNP